MVEWSKDQYVNPNSQTTLGKARDVFLLALVKSCWRSSMHPASISLLLVSRLVKPLQLNFNLIVMLVSLALWHMNKLSKSFLDCISSER